MKVLYKIATGHIKMTYYKSPSQVHGLPGVDTRVGTTIDKARYIGPSGSKKRLSLRVRVGLFAPERTFSNADTERILSDYGVSDPKKLEGLQVEVYLRTTKQGLRRIMGFSPFTTTKRVI